MTLARRTFSAAEHSLSTSPTQPAPLTALASPDDALVRRRMTILCVVYMVVLAIHAGHFFVTGMPDLAVGPAGADAWTIWRN